MCGSRHEPRSFASRRDLMRSAAGMAALTMLPDCATNPETGRSQLLLVGDAQLSQLALSAWSDLKAKTPVSKNPADAARVIRVGTRIQSAAGRGGEAWEFAVFDTKDLNAFVMPGGHVGVYKGLLDFVENDDQLAAVLGHETGHVTAHHAAERASQQEVASLGMSLGEAALSGRGGNSSISQIFGLGLQYGVLLPYSRLQESEADKLGVDYMYRAGYDVGQAIRLWEKMAEAGGSRPPEFLSTHPDPANRMVALRAYINAKGYAKV
jgi:predicted Zn-dependent protease